MKRCVLIFASALLLSGCASINSVSLTPIPAERGKPVQASSDRIIILGFNFDNDFVNPLVDDLKRQCPDGKVSGILTKDENIMYFLFFVWKKQVTVTGYCSNRGKVGSNTKVKSSFAFASNVQAIGSANANDPALETLRQ